jgi:MazG family protein
MERRVMDPRTGELTRLVEIVDRLRDGCPWDREQTLATMAPCAQEEAAEVADAVASGSTEAICEELGDLLMNVFLMARIGEQAGRFSLVEVARNISNKLVHRHPHVFGDGQAETAKQVLANWERIKEAEKAAKRGDAPHSPLDDVPQHLSALLRAFKLGKKAAKRGFDWPDATGALDKVREEVGELAAEVDASSFARAAPAAESSKPVFPAQESARRAALEHELGDLLFAVVNVARKLELDADQALRHANERFERRFRHVEKTLGARMDGATLDEMERVWQQAKAAGL